MESITEKVEEINSGLKFSRNDRKGPLNLGLHLVLNDMKYGGNFFIIGSKEFLFDKYARYAENIKFFVETIDRNYRIDRKYEQTVSLEMSGVLKNKAKKFKGYFKWIVFIVPSAFFFIFFGFILFELTIFI